MSNKIYKTSFIFLVALVPFFAFAQLMQSNMILLSLKSMITTTIIPIVFSLALLMFFWGVVKYIKNEGQGKEDGRRIMIWGIIALFVMSSVWGLVYFVRDNLGLVNTTEGTIPTIR